MPAFQSLILEASQLPTGNTFEDHILNLCNQRPIQVFDNMVAELEEEFNSELCCDYTGGVC